MTEWTFTDPREFPEQEQEGPLPAYWAMGAIAAQIALMWFLGL